jgi:hypothetical protein
MQLVVLHQYYVFDNKIAAVDKNQIGINLNINVTEGYIIRCLLHRVRKCLCAQVVPEQKPDWAHPI